MTLVWPSAPGGDYCLIVDGNATADADAEQLTVEPTFAVLHRVAGAPSDTPSCVAVLSRPTS